MVEATHPDLSVSAQCRLLSISQSSFYYAPQPESDETLTLMRVIDAAFVDMLRSWQPADGLPSAAPGRQHRPPAGAAADGEDGAIADLPAAADQ